MIRYIDNIADWILRLSTRIRMRIGVILTVGSMFFYPYLFFSGEPPIIYFLSVLATTLTGITIILSAEPNSAKEEE